MIMHVLTGDMIGDFMRQILVNFMHGYNRTGIAEGHVGRGDIILLVQPLVLGLRYIDVCEQGNKAGCRVLCLQ